MSNNIKEETLEDVQKYFGIGTNVSMIDEKNLLI